MKLFGSSQQHSIFVFFLQAFSLQVCLSSKENSKNRHHHHHHQRNTMKEMFNVNDNQQRFPYFVQVHHNGDFLSRCSGTLIHREFILTAAHCFKEPKDLSALTATIFSDNTKYHEKVVPITNIIQYPFYNDDNINMNAVEHYYDVALLQIDPLPVEYDKNLVSLDSTANNDKNNDREQSVLEIGDSITTIGYDSLFTTDNIDEQTLQQAELKIVHDNQCDQPTYYETDSSSSSSLYRQHGVSNTIICAESIHDDSCFEGSGGNPLLVLGNDHKTDVQVGLVAFNKDCTKNNDNDNIDSKNHPSSYVDITFAKEWIDSTICSLATTHDNENKKCTVTIDATITPIHIQPGDTCRDFAGAFYVDWWHQFQRCDWLRDNNSKNHYADKYCYRTHEAWVQCPLTCHGCAYDDGNDDDDDNDNDNDNKTTNVDDWLPNDNYYFDKSSSPIPFIIIVILTCILLFHLVWYLLQYLNPIVWCTRCESPSSQAWLLGPSCCLGNNDNNNDNDGNNNQKMIVETVHVLPELAPAMLLEGGEINNTDHMNRQEQRNEIVVTPTTASALLDEFDDVLLESDDNNEYCQDYSTSNQQDEQGFTHSQWSLFASLHNNNNNNNSNNSHQYYQPDDAEQPSL